MTKNPKLKKATLKVDLFRELEKDKLKEQIDLAALFRHFGVELEEKGSSCTGLCPWHDDTTPSLSVSREKGLFNCFGCGMSGDAFTVVEKFTGCDFKEAKAFLQEYITTGRAGLPPFKPAAVEKDLPPLEEIEPTVEELCPSVKVPADDEKGEPVSPDDLVKHWHTKLYENKAALDYLESRGFTDPGLYSRFKLGYADGSLPGKLSEQQKTNLIERGILNEKGNEKFYTCIIFPIADEHGRTVSLYGRSIKKEAKVKHLYLKGGHKGVFNRKASKVYPERIILTECIIDALSLIRLGFENVQSLYGVNGFTAGHLQVLRDDRVKELVLAFDNDEAGRTGAQRLKEQLLKEGFAVRMVFPPAGKDWNDVLLEGITKDDIQQLLDRAELFTPPGKERFEVKKEPGKYVVTLDHMIYTLTGVQETFVSSLKVNIKASGENEVHYDTLNLYSARSRSAYALSLSRLFSLEPRRIEKDLIHILEHLEAERDKQLAGDRPIPEELTPGEIKGGMELLQSPDLFDRIVEDLSLLGYVGEDLNKKLVYLCATSRKMEHPISVLLVSQSASGKSYLIDTVKKLMPPDETESITTLSDQALNYMDNLVGKFVVFGEAVHSETIEHQLREMLSSRELSRYVVQKDPKTGELSTRKISKPVVVSSAMSTTNHRINPENASRYFMVNTDESPEQTRRIHESQRGKYSLERYRAKRDIIPEIIMRHHSAQRLLKQVGIVNPFAAYLDFPVSLMRSRRDHDRFIDLIAVVCFLRQFQKESKTHEGIEYIECDLTDYSEAYTIMVNGVLASTMNELPIQAVTLYDTIREMIHDEAEVQNLSPGELSFTQRDIREYGGFNQMFVKRYIRILAEFEYLAGSGYSARGSRKTYRLVSDEPLTALDTGMIPSPQAMEERLKVKAGQAGQTGS